MYERLKEAEIKLRQCNHNSLNSLCTIQAMKLKTTSNNKAVCVARYKKQLIQNDECNNTIIALQR